VLRTLTAITLALLATVSYAQIYKQVDEDGNVTFTDQPPADGQPVELGTTNTAPPPVNAYPRRAAPSEKAAKSTYTATITSPANETIIPNGPGNFSVSATVSPALQGDHRLQLLIDGTPAPITLSRVASRNCRASTTFTARDFCVTSTPPCCRKLHPKSCWTSITHPRRICCLTCWPTSASKSPS